MRLVVGLGNPGKEYVGTRHNVGWEALDQLARRLGWIGKTEDFNGAARKKFDGLVLDGTVRARADEEKVMLLKPTTFMNRSGDSVQAAAAFYQILPADMMIVLDDLALPTGKLRIRKGGSSGGHNGLRDIERALGTDQYPRLRIGIDAPAPPMPGKAYVLAKFDQAQRTAIEPALERAVEAIVSWIENGIDTAMNAYNVNEASGD
jgi:PTH1 family peptidyl-tRNA hydrolase